MKRINYSLKPVKNDKLKTIKSTSLLLRAAWGRFNTSTGISAAAHYAQPMGVYHIGKEMASFLTSIKHLWKELLHLFHWSWMTVATPHHLEELLGDVVMDWPLDNKASSTINTIMRQQSFQVSWNSAKCRWNDCCSWKLQAIW